MSLPSVALVRAARLDPSVISMALSSYPIADCFCKVPDSETSLTMAWAEMSAWDSTKLRIEGFNPRAGMHKNTLPYRHVQWSRLGVILLGARIYSGRCYPMQPERVKSPIADARIMPWRRKRHSWMKFGLI